MKELVLTKESIELLANAISNEMESLARLNKDCFVPEKAKELIREELVKYHTLLDYILSYQE